MRTHCQLTQLHLHCLQIHLFLCLVLYGFNLSISNLFALLQIFSLNIMRDYGGNICPCEQERRKQPAHYWPVLTLWQSWPDTVNVSGY